MAELTQPTAGTSTPTDALLFNENPGELTLNGPGPFTVNVTLKGGFAWFWLASNPGEEYSGGVEWKSPKGAGPTSINFVFTSPAITQLISESPGLNFLAVSGRSQRTTPIARPAQIQTYRFAVLFVDGSTVVRGSIDPVVIVTPIDNA